MNNYGDFEEIKEETRKNKEEQEQENLPSRVKLPGKNQMIGAVVERLG